MAENEHAVSGFTRYLTGDPSTWAPEQDAVAAAPDNHKVLMENDQVRVLEVTILPGQAEPHHHHKWRSAMIVVGMEDFVDRDKDGNVIFDTRELPEPLQLPATLWKQSEGLHSVWNVSKTTPVHLYRVEIRD